MTSYLLGHQVGCFVVTLLSEEYREDGVGTGGSLIHVCRRDGPALRGNFVYITTHTRGRRLILEMKLNYEEIISM